MRLTGPSTSRGALRGALGRVLVAGMAGAAAAACGTAGDRARLEVRLSPGEQYTYRFVATWTGRVESPGEPPVTFSRREESEILRVVESLDPVTRVATLRETADSLAREFRLDATRERKWTRRMTLKVGSDGRVLSVGGLDRADGFLGRRYFELLLDQSVPEFPDTPILPGHSWRQRRSVPLPGAGRSISEARFRYEGPAFVGARRCARISEQNHLIIPFEQDGERGVDESFGRGSLYVDLETGILVREEIEREVHPRRWIRQGGSLTLQPGETVYHASERLELTASTPRPLS